MRETKREFRLKVFRAAKPTRRSARIQAVKENKYRISLSLQRLEPLSILTPFCLDLYHYNPERSCHGLERL